ncbi:hypothetical protein BH11MYX2_BH11MYX2_26970 [soil metagenome]
MLVTTDIAAACPPTVIVEGTAALREAVEARLAQRSIATSASPDCPATHARVTASGESIMVDIIDAQARESHRSVADAAAAAAVLESWVRPELYASLLERRDPTSKQVAEREEPSVLVDAATPTVQAGPPIHVGIDAVTSVGTDGSLWLGVDAAACVRFGPTCDGVVLRFGQDTAVAGDSELRETDRKSFDLLLAVDLPGRRGDWSITPGAQAGLALHRSTYVPEVSIPMQTARVDTGVLRVGAHVALENRVFAHWALGVDLALDATFGGSRGTFDPDEPGIALAAPPRGFVRLCARLRYEGF